MSTINFYVFWAQVTRKGLKAELYAVEVDARGLPAKTTYNPFKHLGLARRSDSSFMERESKVALSASHGIFIGCSFMMIVESFGKNLRSNSRVLSSKRAETRNFPEEFIFGASTAAYQIEGAWNEDGRSMSIWDVASHFQTSVNRLKETGDVTADSYHNVDRDIKLMNQLNLHAYRFSISWSRILPTGLSNYINEAGVQYYDKLLNEMLKHNIEPFITLYHFDLPQSLQAMGGFLNPSIITWFEDYARVMFKLYGDRVRHWITFNDPYKICMEGYGDEEFPPFMYKKANSQSGKSEYNCARNLLLAHANVWHMYDADFRDTQGGYVSIAISSNWYEPFLNNNDDNEAATEALEFELGIFANPIFSESGDFPYIVKEQVAAKSDIQGFKRSRLPPFSPQEVDFIRGTADFFSLISYSTKYAARNESLKKRIKPSYFNDIDVEYLLDARWPRSVSHWLQSVPWGMYKLLMHIKAEYNNPPLIIAENGYPTKGGINDIERVEYLYDYLTSILVAMDEGADVQGYFVWTLLDGFQWDSGYRERFGLFEVDFQSALRTVKPRKSALVYRQIINSMRVDRNYKVAVHGRNEEANLHVDYADFL